MGKTRQKKVLLPTNITREEAETAFASFAEADAKQQIISATMDRAITKIRDKHADELSTLTERKQEAFEVLQVWAENNRDDFGKKKSIDLTHGVVGFRTGTPKLKTRKGFTWESCLQLVKTFMPTYIRTKEEIAKDALLADRNTPEIAAQFNQIGVMVDQDETFFVEPKKEILQEA